VDVLFKRLPLKNKRLETYILEQGLLKLDEAMEKSFEADNKMPMTTKTGRIRLRGFEGERIV
jgi:hypothetical protein